VMNIKHPCKPKPVCNGIPIAILLQDGLQDFKCAGITLVYTRSIPGLGSADSEKISLVYPSHIPFTWKSMEQVYTRYIPGIWKWLSYDRYIPGISQGYDIHGHNPGIYQVYTTKFPSMGIPDACGQHSTHLCDWSWHGPLSHFWHTVAVSAMRPTRLNAAASSIAHSHTVHATGGALGTSLPLRCRSARVRRRVEGHRGRIVGGQATRSQDGRLEAAATDTAAAPLRQFAGDRPALMEMKAQPGTWTTTRSRAGKVPS
jgi:hypothetical protein